MSRLKKGLTSVMLSGGIILIVGLYYMIIKAGLPYQDAPMELQIAYAVNQGIGDTLSTIGFMMLAAAGVGRLILFLICHFNGSVVKS